MRKRCGRDGKCKSNNNSNSNSKGNSNSNSNSNNNSNNNNNSNSNGNSKGNIQLLQLRLRSGLRQSGSRFAAAFYGMAEAMPLSKAEFFSDL